MGKDITDNYNGYETIDIYRKFIEKSKMTWFSTNALATGISKKMKNEFINAINNGIEFYIYFVIGISGGGFNKIEYSAEVVNIESKPGGILSPEEWKHIKSTIWIKIKNIEKTNEISIDQFIFCKNKRPLY